MPRKKSTFTSDVVRISLYVPTKIRNELDVIVAEEGTTLTDFTIRGLKLAIADADQFNELLAIAQERRQQRQQPHPEI